MSELNEEIISAKEEIIDDAKHVNLKTIEITEEQQLHTKKWYDGFKKLVYWYPDYEKEEKKLLLKLDIALLSYACLSYFTKSLDKSNITNAYVTGMKQDIHFTGNDLSYAKSLYSAGYIVSMCVGTMFVTRKWTRLMCPTLECIWGVLTFCESAVTTPSQLFAIRFLIGLAEGPIFPSVVFILGSWYKRDELYRRVMAFSISSTVGGMFSGYLQSAAYKHLDGVAGKTGWQWGFIIDGIFTVPVALIGFFVFPGTPYQIKSMWWLKPEELKLAIKRTLESGIAAPRKLEWGLARRVLVKWHVHFFATFWVLLNIVALPDGTAMPLWLAYERDNYNRFTTSQVNNYPTFQSALSIVAQFICAGLSDSFSIYPFLTFVQLCFIVSYSSLAAWNIPIGWKWVCMILIGLDSTDQAIVSGWINRTCRHDSEERAFVLGYSDAVSQAINIWTNIVFYPTDDAPQFRLGFIISTVAAFLMLLLPIAGIYGEKYDARKLLEKKLAEEHEVDSLENSSTNSIDHQHQVSEEPKV